MGVSFIIRKEGYKFAVFFLLLSLFLYSSFQVEASVAKERQLRSTYSYIFIFNNNLTKERVLSKVSEIAKKHQLVIQSTFKQVNKGFTSIMSEQAAAQLAQDPDINYYEKNSLAPQFIQHPVSS